MSLSYRIIDGPVDLDVTDRVTSPELGWTEVGGFEHATLKVDLSRETFPTLGSQSRVVVTSPTGDIVWEGFASDPGPYDGPGGGGLSIAAVGSMVRASDVVEPLVYLDTELGSWEPMANLPASGRADNGDAMLQVGFQSGYAIGTGATAGFEYTKLSHALQSLGTVVLTYACGVSTDYAVAVAAIDSAGNITNVASWPATTATVTRTVALPAGTRVVQIQLRRTGAATNVLGELAVARITKVQVYGARLNRFGAAAADAATDLTSADVVEDLIGRGILADVDAARAIVEDSPAVYRQLAFPEGIRGSGVLAALRESDPNMVWTYGGRYPDGYHFSWRRRSSTSRYDIDDDSDLDRPGGEEEPAQRLRVYYTNLDGVRKFTTVTAETPAGARVRDADPLSIEDPVDEATALQRGRDALAALTPNPAGKATVDHRILDRDAGALVEPWELRPGLATVSETGELVRVTDVTWSGGGDNGDAAAVLTVGSPQSTLEDKIVSIINGDLVPNAPLIPLPPSRPAPLTPLDIPSTDPTSAPETSPAPTVYAGNSAAIVVWPPVLDAHTQVDLHVSATDGAAPSSLTLLAQDVQPLVAVSKMADGTDLPANADVYFALVARNVAGTATPSAWVRGRPGKVPPELITLSVETLLADQVVAQAVATSGLQIGNGTWDQTKLSVPGVFNIPFNGDPADITVQLNALTAVIQNLRVLGQNNIIEGGLDLANGVAPPTVRPRAAVSWSHAGASVQAYNAFPGWRGLLWVDGSYWTTFFNTSTYLAKAVAGGLATSQLLTPKSATFHPYGGVVRIGVNWYVLGFDSARANDYYIYRFDAGFNKTGEMKFLTYSGTLPPCLATDGASLFVAFALDSGELRVNQYETNRFLANTSVPGIITRYDVLDTGWPLDSSGVGSVRGLYVGSADLGATRFVVAHAAGIRVYTKAGGASGATQARVPANDWAAANGEEILGLAWDGTSFGSLSASGKVWRYSARAAAESVAVAYSYLDSDPAGGKHETQPSAALTYTAKPRTWTRVDVDPPNDGGGIDDPDSVSIYLGNHRQADLAPGVVMAVYDKFDLTGPAGQTINGFASLPNSIGEVRSARADGTGRIIQLSGDGTGRTGPLKWDAAGQLISFSAAAFMQSGTTTVVLSNAASGFVDVVFPKPFATTPRVVASVLSHSIYFASALSATPNGVRIYVNHRDGTSATVSVTVTWIATLA